MEMDWTTNTLYIHFQQIAKDLGERIERQLSANERVYEKSESSMAERFNILETNVSARFNTFNEIRQTAADAAAKGISRTEVDSRVDSLNEKIASLSSRMDRRDGTGAGMANLWVILVAGFSLIIGMAGVTVAILKR